MATGLRLTITIVVLLAGWPAAAVAQQKPAPPDIVRIDGASTLRVCGDCNARRVTLEAVRLAGTPIIEFIKDPPVVVEVTRDSIRVSPAEAAAFSVAWVTQIEPASLALAVMVAPTLREPGTYSLSVSLLPRSRPQHTRKTLNISVPSASLEVPAKIRVDRTVYWPGSLARFNRTDRPPFVVRETGRRTNIEDLRIGTELTPFTDGGRAVTGSLKTTSVGVGRDASVEIPYSVVGAFPLGTATGALLLRAPELDKPVSVPVEVISRLSLAYLVIAIVAGFVASWLVKVRLAGHIQLTQARALAQKLLGTVEDDKRRFREPEFAAAVAEHETKLRGIEATGDAALVDSLRSTLDSHWRAAVQAAENRRTVLRSRISTFSELVLLDWRLPSRLQTALEKARTDAQPLAATPTLGDVVALGEQLNAAQSALAGAIFQHGGPWQRASRLAFDQVIARPLGLPATTSALLATAVADTRTKCQMLDRLPQSSAAVTIEPLLRTVSGEYLAAADAAAMIALQLDRNLADVLAVLAPQGVTLPRIVGLVAAVKSILGGLADDPGQASAPLLNRLTELQLAWEVELPTLVAAPAVQTEVRTLTNERRFLDAASAVARANTPAAGKGFLGGSAPSVATAVQQPDPFAASLLPFTSGGQPIPVGASPAAPYFAQFIASTEHLRALKAAQTVVLAALFLVWAYGKYSVSWDGTGSGLTTVFFGAFAADVGIDALLTKLKS